MIQWLSRTKVQNSSIDYKDYMIVQNSKRTAYLLGGNQDLLVLLAKYDLCQLDLVCHSRRNLGFACFSVAQGLGSVLGKIRGFLILDILIQKFPQRMKGYCVIENVQNQHVVQIL